MAVTGRWFLLTIHGGSIKCKGAKAGVDIRGATAKSRKHKFVPTTHPGTLAVVPRTWKL